MLLPFELSDILVPGERRQLVFKEGRFLDILDDDYDDDDRYTDEKQEEESPTLLGAVYMGPDNLLPTVSLLEIATYTIDAGFRGKITATVELLCIGRVQLDTLNQIQPVMQGMCTELVDGTDVVCQESPTAEKQNKLVRELETYIPASDGIKYKECYQRVQDALSNNCNGYLSVASTTAWTLLILLDFSSQERYQAVSCMDTVERLEIIRNACRQRDREVLRITSFPLNTYDSSGFE